MRLDTTKSKRIDYLRDYYMNNSQMVLNRDLVAWKCHKSLYNFVEGWMVNRDAQTLKFRRALSERYMLERVKPIIIEGELIVGQPDFTPFATPEEEERYEKYCQIMYHAIPEGRGRTDHLALDYEKLLTKGINGVIEEIKEKMAPLNLKGGEDLKKYEFYKCMLIELEGVLVLQNNYHKALLELAENSEGEQKNEYLKIAETIAQVPANPVRTFREALQSIQLFVYSLFGLYSIGRPDQFLYPYYKNDIAKGVLTEAEAQEYIDCFCLQYMNTMSAWAAAGFMLGGRDGEGNAVENELTWHFLAAIEHTHIPDPNVGFCVTNETSPEMLKYVASIIKAGHGQPQIWNNDGVTKSLLNYGYDPVAANLYTHSTCVEVTPIGCSGISITSPYVNMLKIFNEAFDTCTDDMTFEDVFATYKKAFEDYCDEAILQENLWQLERSRSTTDPLRISAFINDCIARGMSNDEGGARYNDIEPNMHGMTNVIESLNVINELVFNQKKITISELQKVLKNNYEGAEELRGYIVNKINHFGTGTEHTNALAKRVADLVLDTFGRYETFRGSRFIPGSFSYRGHEEHGRATSASPDGRRSGDTLADGSGPVQGYDNMGPTLSLKSTLAWEPSRFLGGIAVNVKLASSTTEDVIMGLIKGYCEQGGVQLQFNVVDTETLIDAQKNPDKYGDLLVRIGGYSDYFTRIPKRLQDEVISRSQN